ncbi:hypothetical protein [Haladaptatus sp. T7]|uniref:hypothetical protein n=1 Tax=Haladaptatus sp. T7 TaxID=2029368 RepID=UPI00222EA0B0|nr:hypothetical protein [Haladaptatus sp. T7]
MRPHLHRRRVRQLLTTIAVLLALAILEIREFTDFQYGFRRGLLSFLIVIFGWVVVIVGLFWLAVTFGREAQKWLQEQETTDTEG